MEEENIEINDEGDQLLDFEHDETEPLPSLQIASVDSASISEKRFWSKVKFKTYPTVNPKQRWYQKYSLHTTFDTPKPSENSEISALEFINFIKGANGQDCRPKIFDNITQTYQMFDTGAMTSCVPKEPTDKVNNNFVLKTADGKPMQTYGYRRLNLRLGRKEYAVNAIITDVKQPIIGMDLINSYRLGFEWDDDELYVVDKKADIRQKLKFVTIPHMSMPTALKMEQKSQVFELAALNKLCPNKTSKDTSKSTTDDLLKLVPEKYRSLIQEYGILKPNYKVKPKHKIVHRIETGTNSPATSKVRPIPADKLDEVKALLNDMEKAGVIEKVGVNSNTNWSSALHVVREEGKKPRVCVDYRLLNERITNDSYPLPLIRNISQKLHSAKYFTKIDLQKAYWNIPLFGPHKHKSTVVTPFGAYFFNRLPFGISSAPNSFQRALETIFDGIEGLFIYMDDLLCYSSTPEEHYAIVTEVIKRLHDNGMAISLDKCIWEQPKVEYLGFEISESGLKPVPRKIEAITKIPEPRKQKDLLAFLGAANFYRRSLSGLTENGQYKNAAALIQCLYTLATEKGLTAKKFVQKWNSQEIYKKAFEDAKQLLKQSANLVHINPNAQLALFVDASGQSLGGTLRQLTNTGWKAIGYYSKSLNTAQQKYSTFRKELLGLVMSLRHFLPEIYGRRLVCYSDHKAIVDAFKKQDLKQNDQIATRYMLEISQFTSNIQHVSGSKNITADFLSRCDQRKEEKLDKNVYQVFHPLNSQNSGVSTAQISTSIGVGQIDIAELVPENTEIQTVDIPKLQQEQQDCNETKAAIQGKHAKTSKFAVVQFDGKDIVCETSKLKPRPLVPASLRQEYIKTLHSIGHPSIMETVNRVSNNYFWNKLKEDVTTFVKKCHGCLSVKPNKQTKPHIGNFAVPDQRFSHLIVDIIEMPMSEEGFKFCFTIICRTSRYFCAYAMKKATTENCLTGLLDFISHFGVPHTMTADAGTQFISSLWKKLNTTLGIELKGGAYYRPQTQGMVEVSHRTLKNAIKAQLLDFANKNQQKWNKLLPWALLSMRASYRTDLQASPSELAHGLKPMLPGSLIADTQPSTHLQDLLNQVKSKTDRQAVQTKINQPNPPQPEPPEDVTHVYTLQHKKYGLDPSYCGPFKIDKRLTRSTVRIIVGTYKNNSKRTEDRHWSDLKAIKIEGPVKEEERPKLGRKPNNSSTKAQEIPLPTKSTGPPTSQPFTGFKPDEIKKRPPLIITEKMFDDCDWKQIFSDVSALDFSKPPPPTKMWTASPIELASLNEKISNSSWGTPASRIS